MCGIVGSIEYLESNEIVSKYIRKMTASLAHRGPNNQVYGNFKSNSKLFSGHQVWSLISFNRRYDGWVQKCEDFSFSR